MATSKASLFDQLAAAREVMIPVYLQSATFESDPETGRMAPVKVPGQEPIRFDIRSLSCDELVAADAVLDAAKPRKILRDEPGPRGVGMIQVEAGWDTDHPDYIKERSELLPQRHAMVCLAGCPALAESTPGNSMLEQARTLTERLPAVIVEWLAGEIEKIAMFNAVGHDAVDRVFPKGSGQSQKRPATSKPTAAEPRKK